ncbi:transcriptional regulator, SarA/Rot family [Limosilactobacillus reuteri]
MIMFIRINLLILPKYKPGSLTQILEKMEHEQLIIRKRDHNDKRLIYVRLSNKGKEQFRNEKLSS